MKKISKETIIRTGVLILTLANTLLSAFGKNPLPFSENDIYQAVSAICTVAATIWAWWKNNSFTSAALKADEYMKELKAESKKGKEAKDKPAEDRDDKQK